MSVTEHVQWRRREEFDNTAGVHDYWDADGLNWETAHTLSEEMQHVEEIYFFFFGIKLFMVQSSVAFYRFGAVPIDIRYHIYGDAVVHPW
jgi:hypothetical protein